MERREYVKWNTHSEWNIPVFSFWFLNISFSSIETCTIDKLIDSDILMQITIHMFRCLRWYKRISLTPVQIIHVTYILDKFLVKIDHSRYGRLTTLEFKTSRLDVFYS